MKISLSGRRTRAAERTELSNGRTPEQQLAELDKRLGKGVGAARERARLAALVTPKADAPKKKTKKV